MSLKWLLQRINGHSQLLWSPFLLEARCERHWSRSFSLRLGAFSPEYLILQRWGNELLGDCEDRGGAPAPYSPALVTATVRTERRGESGGEGGTGDSPTLPVPFFRQSPRPGKQHAPGELFLLHPLQNHLSPWDSTAHWQSSGDTSRAGDDVQPHSLYEDTDGQDSA